MKPESTPAIQTITIRQDQAGRRLDQALAGQLDLSRSRIAALVSEGFIKVNGVSTKNSHRVVCGDLIDVEVVPRPAARFEPQPIPLDVIYEDAGLLVLNKPAGQVVHPAPGHFDGTLVNALLHHYPEFQDEEGDLRPGIVHRLDKDTTGLLLVARTAAAKLSLIRQFQARTIEKHYRALACGSLARQSGVIDAPIGRHPKDRKKMGILATNGRNAVSHWRVLRQFAHNALLDVRIETGRTHQIRVHLQSIGHPVVGDPVYGWRQGQCSVGPNRKAAIKRQMLHAFEIAFDHPQTGKRVRFQAPLPADFSQLLEMLSPE